MSRRRASQHASQTNLVEKLQSEAKNVQVGIEETLTVLWNDLPSWQQDNHYILSGYRPETNSYKRSFASLSYIHNETVNIWTHLVGAVVAIFGGVYFWHQLRLRFEHASNADVLAFSCFFGGAAACLGMSATYHTISNHSPRVSRVGNQLDYVGIVCLIWGSFIPSIYYGFHREPFLRNVYWSMVRDVLPTPSPSLFCLVALKP